MAAQQEVHPMVNAVAVEQYHVCMEQLVANNMVLAIAIIVAIRYAIYLSINQDIQTADQNGTR